MLSFRRPRCGSYHLSGLSVGFVEGGVEGGGNAEQGLEAQVR
ncbi:MAG: hypothetical protein ACE5GO_08100 [Anaerolineales bacterium]